MPPRLKALWLLAWHLVRTLVRRAFGGGRNGLRRFEQNYAADGLSAVSAEQRAEMASFGRCIACGLCDRGEAGRIIASKGVYNGVMPLILAASRSMPDYAAAAKSFAFVPDSVLAEKEKICPAHVPMIRIALFVRDKALTARGSLPPAES
jgi:hypothetical protein